ncbi:flagellin [Polynucleobacter sp. MWH-UH35A]|uniref:flagellin N-terminal helical domain-containing protein n=1 Tax=Polynucleobacter sp. MWH-UH35A TaxID=1855619 RepID=UPI001BFD2F6E|nr:flagellin [Polynucleobacter sp. MWH-UH35A]QWD59752.1 flagellin [Polynucleobacter sp. MWH-UH35A]
MATVINTNLASLYAQNNLSNAQNNLANSVQRLSSGLRINSAKDDAAGLAISQFMQNQINGVNQSRRNLNDATNLIQTADTSLGTIQDMLLRIKTLTTQGYDGSLSASQRTQIVDEINELNTEINATAARTKFNRNNLISSTVSASITTGGTNIGTSSTTGSINSVSANTMALGTFTLAGSSGNLTASSIITSTYAGAVTSTTYSQTLALTDYAGTAAGVKTINFDQIGLSLNITATSIATATLLSTDLNGKVITTTGGTVPDLYFQGGSDTSTPNMVVYDAINMRTDTTSGGFQAMNDLGGQINLLNSYTTSTAQATWANAFSTMGTFVDAALDVVSEQRSNMGALQNRISYINQNLEAYSTNLQSSRSAITDTDFAAETAKLTKGQIMQQAATAMLAQANQMPNIVLSLLK